MKKLFLLLTALIVSCSLFADTDNYEVTWDIPGSGLVLNIYVWEGLDTLTAPFFPNTPLDESSSLFQKQVSPYSGLDNITGIADGKTYISVMGQYKKLSNGLLGNTYWATVKNTTSHFRLSNDKAPPEDVENMQIEE